MVHLVASGAEPARVVVQEGDHLPEGDRDAHPVNRRVARAEIRPGEDGDAHVVLSGVLQCVVLERQPDRRVERLHLRHGIGDVHRVFVAALRRRPVAPPAGILATRHVTAAELRRIAVALVHDLLRARDPRVPFPRLASALLRQPAVDVAGAEGAHASATAHHHRVVLVAQDVRRPTAVRKGQDVVGPPRHARQRYLEALAEEVGAIALAVAVIVRDRLARRRCCRRRRRLE